MEGEFLVNNNDEWEEEKEKDGRSGGNIVGFREVKFSLRDDNGDERGGKGKGYVKKGVEWFEFIGLVVIGVHHSN